MSDATSGETSESSGSKSGVGVEMTGGSNTGFMGRQLAHYPATAKRYWLLGVVVVTTIVLYYVYFIVGSVTTLMLPYYHMSFYYFLTLLVVANAIGAFTVFIGALSDKFGRANLTIVGMLVVGLIQTFAIPNAHSSLSFSVGYCAMGFFEGIILVVTPALIRDFSPQLGRASAMGFWALGPVLGSLTVSQVANHTLTHLPPWQDQFIISGVTCLIMFVISLFALRELSPQIRDQLMVSAKEMELIEARALGFDAESATANPWKQMFRIDLLASAGAISIFLLLYYAAVTIFTLYWVVIYGQSTANANGINTWYFVLDAVGLIAMGALSDKLHVRKPFMIFGGSASIVVFLIFISKVNSPNTGYYTLALLVALLGFSSATAYAPWMANYTEAVEAKNPALTATGLSVWGWLLRIIVAASFLVIPHVIPSSNTLVNNQSQANALTALQNANPYAPGGTMVGKPMPASYTTALNAIGADGQALAVIINKGLGALTPTESAQVPCLLAFKPLVADVLNNQAVPAAGAASLQQKCPLSYTRLTAAEVIIPAKNAAAHQWKDWWWVCLGGQILFLALVFVMPGRWSPKAARQDLADHQARVAKELASIGGSKS